MAVEIVLWYGEGMKAFMVVVFVLASDPSLSLQKIIFHKTRAACEVQEGIFNFHLPDRSVVSFRGIEVIFDGAECYDLPVQPTP